MSESAGRYRINVVAELTGVPAPTLRAWERRYGIPAPARTASAYRLYSESDVRMVRQLRDLCARGVAIAEAARVVKAQGDHEAPVEVTEGEDAWSLARRRIVEAAQSFDPAAIEREVAQTAYLGSAAAVFEHVLAPALREVGDLWHAGEISVAQEHLTSGAVMSLVRTFARLVQPAPPAPLVLLACVEDEEHVIGLYGAALRLASWGLRTVELGARTPATALSEAVASVKPDAVGLSVVIAPEPSRGAAMVGAYADACGALPWFVGGAGAAGVRDEVTRRGGLLVGEDLAGARGAIDAALARRQSRA